MQRRDQLEHFHIDHSNSYTRYASPDAKAHGASGYEAKAKRMSMLADFDRTVGVSLPTRLERGIDLLIDAAADYGVGAILVLVCE